MEETTIPMELLSSFKKYAENFEWAQQNFETLQEHVGKYVAIANKEILGFGDDKKSIEKKFKNVDGLFIDLITPTLLWIL